MEKLSARGIPSVVDVSGTYLDVNTREIFRRSQLILLDVKHTKRQAFRDITGKSIDTLFRIIELINDEEVPVWVRQVVVPGINDRPQDIADLRDFVRYSPTVERIELLGYHNMGASKWEQLKIPYKLKDTPPLSEAVSYTHLTLPTK